MRADNAEYLITAASRRHELARSKAIRAIRELDAAGTAVTFQTVAQAAGVSRSWLYTQPDIRAEVQRLREVGCRAPTTALPAHHRTSDASLRRRLETANARNRELTEDNQRLRHQLAQVLGQLRAAGIRPALEPYVFGSPVTGVSASAPGVAGVETRRVGCVTVVAGDVLDSEGAQASPEGACCCAGGESAVDDSAGEVGG